MSRYVKCHGCDARISVNQRGELRTHKDRSHRLYGDWNSRREVPYCRASLDVVDKPAPARPFGSVLAEIAAGGGA